MYHEIYTGAWTTSRNHPDEHAGVEVSMQFQTPEWVCEIMAKMIYDISPFPETILEPTSGEGNLVKAIESEHITPFIYTPSNFFEFDKRVDCIVGNPPFTPMKLGYAILERCFELSDNIIFLMPWLSLINSEKRTELYFNKGLKTITHLPRRAFNGSRVQTCIMQFQDGYRGDVIFRGWK